MTDTETTLQEPDTQTLLSGAVPRGAKVLFARLDELGVTHSTIEHPAVHTVEEALELRGRVEGAHSKNLFLRDKKENHWLVSCLSDRVIDLFWLADRLRTKRLSFCSERRLMSYLGIRPGSVSPFAIINDASGCVNVAVDGELLEREPVNFHPLDNRMTTTVSAEGLVTFLKAEAHAPRIVDFPSDDVIW